MMNPWFAKLAVLAATLGVIVIRAPHGKRSRRVAVAKSYRGTREKVLLTVAWVSFLLTLVWIATPLFAFAEYPLRPAQLAVGVALLVLGLWLFYRSHADLGQNWSVTLEVREQHRLVTEGVYRWVRHPMYLALIVFALGQALAIPNWFVGPMYLAAMLLLFCLRIGPEERMMREEFGAEYDGYCAATKRLVPGVW
jgi:protein-S-isoprenylcysteine O-methyltransferase Ste14